MNMREKEDLVINYLSTKKEATYSEIKAWIEVMGCDKFGPATLTSMVKRDIIIKEEGNYKLPEVMISDEQRELQRRLVDLEGHLNHLENSKSKWNKIKEEFALTADMNSYLSWNQKMYDELYKIYMDTKAEYEKYIEGAF